MSRFGKQGSHLRDAGRSAAVRWRGRRGALHVHHRPQRLVSQAHVERSGRRLQRSNAISRLCFFVVFLYILQFVFVCV